MNPPGKFLGMVRAWLDGEQWKWTPVGKWAPEHAELARRVREGNEEVIYLERDSGLQAIRGAVKW